MVRLDRIYTRGGDGGMTSLGDGQRVRKSHPRITAYGTVDELNATLGVVLQQRGLATDMTTLLQAIQNDLFDVGADLCVPQVAQEADGARLRVTQAQVDRLEGAIDGYTARLEPLRSFILPGGNARAAWLHMARVVCRRAEIQVLLAFDAEPQAVIGLPLVYLNRLSDLLFVMARFANRGGRGDVLWQPGAGAAMISASTSPKAAAAAAAKKRKPAQKTARKRAARPRR